jgi:hypothetical protein
MPIDENNAPPPCSLQKLVAAITEENRHDETLTGSAVGNEFPDEPEMNKPFKVGSTART